MGSSDDRTTRSPPAPTERYFGASPSRGALMFRPAFAALFLLAACGPRPAADQAAPPPAGPNIQTREVEYRSDATLLKGYLAWDSARTGPRPGVLVVHEWWGHNEH